MKRKLINIMLCTMLIIFAIPTFVYGEGSFEPFFYKEENGESYYLVNNGDELKILLESLYSSSEVRHVLLNNDTFYLNDVKIAAANHFVFEEYGPYQKCSFISTDNKGMFFVDERAEGLIMDFSNHNITLTSTKMDGYLTNGTGGVFDVYANNVTLIGGEYVNCSSYDSGGAIYIFGSHPWSNKVLGKECTIKDAKFHQCSSQGGGAIAIKGLNCVVDNCHFWYCSSFNQGGNTNGGGAIKIINDNNKIINCDFHYCTALEDRVGGALDIISYNCYVGNSFFERNSSRSDGGAIYIDDDATIEDCKFQYNSASGDGGSIYDNNAAGDVYIRRCAFRGGNCGGDGVWVDCNGDAHLEGCTDMNSEDYYDSPASYTNPDLYPYDDFEGYDEPVQYTRPFMTSYSQDAINNNENCDVIRPDLGNSATSEHGYFSLCGTSDNGLGWKIDYENELLIMSQIGPRISRIEAVVTSGDDNYESLVVDNGTKAGITKDKNRAVNPYDTNYILTIDNNNTDIVTLRTNGDIFDNRTMHIQDVIIYYSENSTQSGFAGSVLSNGSLTIIVGVAGLTVGLVVGLIIGKKSKKANTKTSKVIDEEDE